MNRAAFMKATICFRFRHDPLVMVDERDVVVFESKRWLIDSVETIKNRYVEVFAHTVMPEGKRDGESTN